MQPVSTGMESDPNSAVVLLLPNSSASQFEAALVRALSIRAQSTHYFIVPVADDLKVPALEAFARWVESRLTRVQQQRVELSELEGGNVEIVCLAEFNKASALRGFHPRLIVDLTGKDYAKGLIGMSRDGLLQFWCNEQPDSLECWSIRDIGRQNRISVIHLPETNDPARIVQDAFLPSCSPYPVLDRRNASARGVALLVRAIAGGVVVRDRARQIRSADEQPGCGPLQSLARITRLLFDGARRGTRSCLYDTKHWFLVYRTNPGSDAGSGSGLRSAHLTCAELGRGSYLADPCVFSYGGVEHVFAEEYIHESKRGVISWCHLQPDGTLSAPVRVLERPYHLSYPFVFEWNDDIYMIPESSANMAVELYRASEFPLRWEFQSTLLSDVNAADATLHYDGKEWWMFVCIGEFGSYARDELFLFSAPRPSGPWQPHKGNPVKVDARSARSAGRLFYRNGRLFRPTQDCSRHYGGAISICCVTSLDHERFEEYLVERIEPSLIPGADALHTISFSERLEVVDAKWRARPRLRVRLTR